LTYNEEKNLKAAIDSIKGISQRIIVVDSFSEDKTVELAKELGAEVIQNTFVNQAQQYQDTLNIVEIKTPWTLRLDADERLSKEACNEIIELIKKDEPNINGVIIPFEVTFLGKKLRFGGIYPFRKMILYKTGKAFMEQRSMDEHLILKEGKTKTLRNISYHDDFKDLTAWIDKHNKYASREVLDYFFEKNEFSKGLNSNAKFKRFIKYNIYFKLPMSLRSSSYFIYRYIFRVGFLDGKPGFIFAVLQAFWYRFLVDSKIYEAKRQKF
jgi:glycosyltransferase involved in cell wall biosynthesis